MAVASAAPYANNLHLAPDVQPHNTPSLNFYRPDALLLDAQPTVSKHFRQVCFTGGWKDYTLFILFAFQVNFVVLM